MADNFLFFAVYCGHFGGERTFSVNEQKTVLYKYDRFQ